MATSSNGLFTLSWKDAGKAILMAFLGTFVAAVYQGISAGAFPTLHELGTAAIAGSGSALAYIVKNFFTNNNDQFAKKDV